MNEKHPEHSQHNTRANPLTQTKSRFIQRRTGHDRRDMIRYEPDKDDRRVQADRRRGNQMWRDNEPV